MHIQRSKSAMNSGYELVESSTASGHSAEIWQHPLGSFTEDDSPPRPPDKRKRSQMSSSPYNATYSGSQPPPYPPSASSYDPYRGYYSQSHHQQQQIHPGYYGTYEPPDWTSPMGVTSSPDHKKRRDPFRSPHKPERSPFRSPPPEHFRRSPAGSVYESFGMMETPRGNNNLEDSFSPLGPGFEEKDGLLVSAGPADADQFEGRLNFSQSGSSSDSQDPPAVVDGSPFSCFVHDFSPMPAGTPASRHHHQQQMHGTASSGPHSSSVKQAMMKSPLPPGPPSETKPRNLWQQPQPPHSATKAATPSTESSTPSALRLKLDGSSYNSAQRGFNDINSMMRSQPSPMQRSGATSSSTTPHHHPQHMTPHHYPSPYNMGHHLYHHHMQPPPPHHHVPHHHHQQQQQPPPHHPHAGAPHHQQPPHVGSAQKTQAPSSASRFAPPPSARKPTPSSATKSVPSSGGDGKENAPNTETTRRVPCNCKKSRCLKLYCECFSGELYCEGCNCVDCHNKPTFDDLRSKAIKETRAKNPRAFKPRFAEQGTKDRKGHTSGCKCKKSECLKKYCEVSSSSRLLWFRTWLSTVF